MGLLKNLVKKVVGAPAPAKAATPPAAPAPAPERHASHGTNAAEAKPWYLDGENDGWDETNPDAEKKA